MMNVLDALRYRLGGQDLGDPSLDFAFRAGKQQPLPPGLPLVVQDAIRNQPSYQEGGRPPPLPSYEPNLPRDDPQNRDYRLNDMLGFNEYMRRNGQYAWPEGSIATQLQPGQSPYASRLPSALNQLMRRGPFGQY